MIELYPKGPKKRYSFRFRITLEDSDEHRGIADQIDAFDLGLVKILGATREPHVGIECPM